MSWKEILLQVEEIEKKNKKKRERKKWRKHEGKNNMNRTVFFVNASFCDAKKKITQKIFSSDENDSEIEIQFNHDISYEEDKKKLMVKVMTKNT